MDTKFKTSELIEYITDIYNFAIIGRYFKSEEDDLKFEEIKRILLEDEARKNYANHLLLEDELLENEMNNNLGSDGVDNYIPEVIPLKENDFGEELKI